MRKLVAMAVIGASAALFSASAPAQAMPTGAAGVAKSAAAPAETTVHQVRRWKHRHYRKWRHRSYGYRPYYRQRYRPYSYGYYGGYGGYGYYPRYYRRPGVSLYFRF